MAAAQNPAVHLDEFYRYDGVSQLVDLQRGQLNANKDAILSKAFAEDWSLDATGNWSAFRQDFDGNGTWDLDQARGHNKANEVTSASSWATPAHDRAGNMTTLPKPASPADALSATFDAWNRMVKVEDGEDTVAEYQYTPDNRRAVKKTYAGGALSETRHFYCTADWQTVEERTASGGSIAADPDTQYVWGTRYVDHLILRDRDTTANGSLDERLYAVHDANFNVTALLNASGSVLERYTYTAYGTVEVRDAAFQPTGNPSAYAWPYTYTTRRLDAETGLMYYRNRMYHPGLGRFVSRDPIGYTGDPENLYRYVANSATLYRDPSGLGTGPRWPGCDFYFPPRPPRCTQAKVDDHKKKYDECVHIVYIAYKQLFDDWERIRDAYLDAAAKQQKKCLQECRRLYPDHGGKRTLCQLACRVAFKALMGKIWAGWAAEAGVLASAEAAEYLACGR